MIYPYLLFSYFRMLLDEYLSTENLKMLEALECSPTPTGPTFGACQTDSSLVVSSVQDSGKKLHDKNKAVMHMCLFIEGIGHFAEALGPTFKSLMIRALYPLVEYLAHENVHLSSTAYASLTQVRIACSYDTLDELLRDNADYLVSSVSLKLRHIAENRRCPQALCVMLRHCSSSLLPVVEHSVLQLLDTLDDHYTQHILLFLPVLLELAKAIERWFPTEAENGSDKDIMCSNSTQLDPLSFTAYIDNYIKLKNTSELDMNDDSESGDPTCERTMEDIEQDMKRLMQQQEKVCKEQEETLLENEANEDEKETSKESPRHVKVVQNILSRVKHFLPSHDGHLRVKSLDIICQCVQNLRGNSKELLPQIHQIWPSFYPLFSSKDKFIVIKALTVLHVISDLGGDFVRQRTMKNIIPDLVSFMEKQAKIR